MTAEDRNQMRDGHAPPREHFKRAIANHAATHRIELPKDSETFTDWIYAEPSRCPGIRFNHEVCRSLLSNFTDVPETADFSDLGHVYAVPYLDAITLDRRIRHYCRQASEKLFGQLRERYSDRIYPHLAAIIDALPA
jgi:hypothetical protein